MTVLRVTAHMLAPIASVEEVHLDSLLTAAHPDVRGRHVTRAHDAGELHHPRLPVVRLTVGGVWVLLSSTWQIPEGARFGRESFTKRRDKVDVHYLAQPFTPSSGPGKNYQLPVMTVETPSVSWLVVGDRRGVRELLRYVQHVGAIRRQGYGRVREWEVERADVDPLRVLVDEQGRAARFLPQAWTSYADALDRGAVVPPYWHPGLAVPRVRPGVRVELLDEVREAVARCR